MSALDRSGPAIALAHNVLSVRPVICVSHGFQSNYERGFCNALAGQGVDVTLVGSDRTDTAGLQGVHVLNLRGSQEEDRPRWRKALNLLRYHAALVGYTLTRPGAVVHVIGMIEPPLWHGVLLGLWFRAAAWRYVLTVHDLMPHDRREDRGWQRRLFCASFRLAHRLVVHTERMRDELIAHFGVKPERVVVMAHGIEPIATVPSLPARARDSARLPVILAFGNIAPYKGTDLLLQALREVTFPFRLVLAGPCRNAEFRELLQQLIAHHPRRPWIEWRDGFISELEMVNLFQTADLLALPYRHIDQSGVLFQALRHGVPVLGTRVGEFERYVTHETGLLAPPNDVAALAAAATDWYERRHSFSRERICSIGKIYEWPATVRALSNAYQA